MNHPPEKPLQGFEDPASFQFAYPQQPPMGIQPQNLPQVAYGIPIVAIQQGVPMQNPPYPVPVQGTTNPTEYIPPLPPQSNSDPQKTFNHMQSFEIHYATSNPISDVKPTPESQILNSNPTSSQSTLRRQRKCSEMP